MELPTSTPSHAGGNGSQSRPALDVYLLGTTDFDASLALQRRLVFELDGGRRSPTGGAEGYLLICEHPPLITVGRQGSWDHIAADPDELLSRQLAVRWVNRGGGCLVHGPGQLALYPLIPLDVRRWGLAQYVSRLQQWLIELAGEFGVDAHANGGSSVAGRLGAFAFVGLAVRDWISYHGAFLNVSPDPVLQRLAHDPCCGPRCSSLAAERGRPVQMHAVREAAIRLLVQHLGYNRFHVYAGHHLLRPPVPAHAVAAHSR